MLKLAFDLCKLAGCQRAFRYLIAVRAVDVVATDKLLDQVRLHQVLLERVQDQCFQFAAHTLRLLHSP